MRHATRSGLAGIALIVILAPPWMRALLESGMAGHMLLQIPLLVLAGILLAGFVPDRWRARLADCNAYGLSGLLLALLTLGYWMLPRSLDLALESGWAELLKFTTLPLLAGLPLALSWRPLGMIGRGVVWSELVAKLAVLGWLYLEAPVRVCTRYLVADQEQVGQALLVIALLLAVVLTLRAFLFDHGRSGEPAEEEAGPRERKAPAAHVV
ncbi:MAG: hypothetical protein LPK58_08845 [Gammaproteobacteria bacterium]|nr:hypothetical protein [Chromatiales bacterium]MDX5334142.1 hypothetical protein [Gammaproteobacteria bacterium]MDX5375634.1 hypothetical protein [Gammaproteobacteria bacterium]